VSHGIDAPARPNAQVPFEDALAKQSGGGWLGAVAASSVMSAAAFVPSAHVGSVWVKLLFPLLLVG